VKHRKAPPYPVLGMVDQREVSGAVDHALVVVGSGAALVGAGTLLVLGWEKHVALGAALATLPLVGSLAMWKSLIVAYLERWTHGHLPFEAMGRVATEVLRAHLPGTPGAAHTQGATELHWRIGRVGVHLHAVRVDGGMVGFDNAHSAILPYTAWPLPSRWLGGLCGTFGITAQTDTALVVHSAHHLLHLLHTDATVLPPRCWRDGAHPKGAP
jgi:hypothetical protein